MIKTFREAVNKSVNKEKIDESCQTARNYSETETINYD